MKLATFTKTGSKATSQTDASDKIFKLDVKDTTLLKQAYLAEQNNQRTNNAKTLKRGDVRGGGRKPWRQKGTGRARAGTIRSPIWRGGGITFGPLGEENYSHQLPRASRRVALRQALSLAAKKDTISVIDAIEAKDGKTKNAQNLVDKLGVDRGVLLVDSELSDEARRAFNNIPFVTVTDARRLSVGDVMDAHHIFVTKTAIKAIEARLGGGNV